MALDSRTPVLVGVAQLEQRIDEPREALEPLELMVRAVERAAEDARSRALLAAASSVRVVRGIWRYANPARIIAERIGAPSAQTALTPYGGNYVQTTLNKSALEIQKGALDVVVITGAECGRTQSRARAAGVRLQWSEAPGEPDLYLGVDRPMNHEAELARGVRMPIQLYAVFENALRHARGESLEAHRRRISELWAGFNAVAMRNPHAWIRERFDAEQIRTPSPSNRMVGFPYTKLMNSNPNVDQAAALILCSLETARRLGVPAERIVFPHAGSDANDHYLVSNRANLRSSPAIRLAGRRALELAGLEVGEIDHFDVYSCFPSAVQVAAAELEIPAGRPLTVTGGLTFGGGPMNNYVMHGIARMADVLRGDRGSFGLCTANGGFLTKHAFGVYSTEPPQDGFRHADLQPDVDKTPQREAVLDAAGVATLEAYTVMFGDAGPDVAHCACLLPDGRRTWANVRDADLLHAMTREEFCGRRARLDGKGELAVVA